MSIHTLRKRFAKDEGLPISVVQDPYFEYLLDLYDPLYGCKKQYKVFMKEVELAGGEEAFLRQYYDIRDKIISDTQKTEAFIRFNQDRLEDYNVSSSVQKSAVYQTENHEKEFFSIDLRQANFHALKFYDPAILNKASTYEEWMSSYTNSEYMKGSKYLRQVIFGNLNPKKQTKIQKYIMSKFLEVILKYTSIDQVKSVSYDELVVSSFDPFKMEALKQEMNGLSESLGVPVRFESFKLLKQGETNELGYVKESLDGELIAFKGVPGLFMPQAFKHYYTLPIDEKDLVFYHEGHLVTFLEAIKTEKALN